MAEPHTLKIGDIVRNREYWPEGETAKIIEFRPFMHISRKKGKAGARTSLTKSRTDRVVIVDHRVRDTTCPEELGDIEKFTDQWMELGLELVK